MRLTAPPLSWVKDNCFPTGAYPCPPLRVLILKLPQLQREFTLSLKDTKTWDKQSLIINTFFFSRGSKAPQTLSKRARVLWRSYSPECWPTPEKGSGSTWLRRSVCPSQSSSALLSRGQLGAERKRLNSRPGAEGGERAPCLLPAEPLQEAAVPSLGWLCLGEGDSPGTLEGTSGQQHVAPWAAPRLGGSSEGWALPWPLSRVGGFQ